MRHYNNCGNCDHNLFTQFFDFKHHRIQVKTFDIFCWYGSELSGETECYHENHNENFDELRNRTTTLDKQA